MEHYWRFMYSSISLASDEFLKPKFASILWLIRKIMIDDFKG